MRYISALCTTLIFAATAWAEEGGAAEHEAAATLFAGTIAQSIAAVIVFLILFAVLWKLAWGPILKGLQSREERIKQDLAQAEAANKKAAATLADYQKKLAEGNIAVQQMLEQGRKDADAQALKRAEELEVQLKSMRDRATFDIKAAKEQALTEIYTQAATLSTSIASRIIKREIRPEEQQALVQESLKELAKVS